MSTRGRFKVPTASQLNKDKNDISSMSLFSNYKFKKTSGDSDKAKEDGKVDKQTASSSSNSATYKTNQKPATSSVPQSVTSSGPSSTSSVKDASSASTDNSTSVPVTASNSTTTPAPVVTGSKPGSGNSIIVNFRQRGNPILKHIRNVPWEYGSIVPDYVMGKANCALYLGLRYHQLHPEYIHKRLQDLGKGYDLRVLLAQVDVPDPHHLLKDLAKICILADVTLILAFSAEEAGRYLESYKVYENKPAEALMEKTDTDFMSKVNDCLTTVKAVNKTDCMTLMSSFKSVEGIVNASKEDLSMCAGFGPHKAQRLYNVLHESFVKGRKRRSNSPTKTESAAGSSPMKKPG